MNILKSLNRKISFIIAENYMKLIETLNSNAMYRIMQAIMHQIVFTNKEIEIEPGVSRNIVSTLIDKLEVLGIIAANPTYTKLCSKYIMCLLVKI